MPLYSVVVSIYGWSAKNMTTGKTLSGGYEELPIRVSVALGKLVIPSTNSLCIATTVPVSDNNEFNRWFEGQPVFPTS